MASTSCPAIRAGTNPSAKTRLSAIRLLLRAYARAWRRSLKDSAIYARIFVTNQELHLLPSGARYSLLFFANCSKIFNHGSDLDFDYTTYPNNTTYTSRMATTFKSLIKPH